MSEFYGTGDDGQSLQTLQYAFDRGITFFDTADMYGSGHNEELLSRFLKDRREQVVLATKFGIRREDGAYERTLDTSPAYVKAACEASLKRLGTNVIDLYYMHRRNPEVPIEDTVGAMADLVREGKVKALGLCEVSPETLRRAQAIHPIAAVQTEYSLSTRDVENGILPVCRTLNVAFIPYSPLGRGLLTKTPPNAEALEERDVRRILPRFSGDNLAANVAKAKLLDRLAADKGATPAQIALAWLLHQGEDIIPIPGTRRIANLEDNLGAVEVVLSERDMAMLDEAFPPHSFSGERYTEEGMKGVNV